MKRIILGLAVFTCITFSIGSKAQVPEMRNKSENRLFVGVGVQNTQFVIVSKQEPKFSNVTSFAAVHAGYKINRRITGQLGFTYGSRKTDYEATYHGYNGNIINYRNSDQVKLAAVPVTLKYYLFNPEARMRMYGTASFIVGYYNAGLILSQTQDNKTSTTADNKSKGINTFLIAGAGIDFRISNKFSSFAEFRFYNNTLSNQGYYNRREKSFGLGVNYSFSI